MSFTEVTLAEMQSVSHHRPQFGADFSFLFLVVFPQHYIMSIFFPANALISKKPQLLFVTIYPSECYPRVNLSKDENGPSETNINIQNVKQCFSIFVFVKMVTDMSQSPETGRDWEAFGSFKKLPCENILAWSFFAG